MSDNVAMLLLWMDVRTCLGLGEGSWQHRSQSARLAILDKAEDPGAIGGSESCESILTPSVSVRRRKSTRTGGPAKHSVDRPLSSARAGWGAVVERRAPQMLWLRRRPALAHSHCLAAISFDIWRWDLNDLLCENEKGCPSANTAGSVTWA